MKYGLFSRAVLIAWSLSLFACDDTGAEFEYYGTPPATSYADDPTCDNNPNCGMAIQVAVETCAQVQLIGYDTESSPASDEDTTTLSAEGYARIEDASIASLTPAVRNWKSDSHTVDQSDVSDDSIAPLFVVCGRRVGSTNIDVLKTDGSVLGTIEVDVAAQ